MTRASSILSFLTCLAVCWASSTVCAQTEAGPPPEAIVGGQGTPGDVASTSEPATQANTPAGNTEDPAPNGNGTPPALNEDGEPLPDAMRSPRRMVELLLDEAEAVLVRDELEARVLLKYLPSAERRAFDRAGLRDARRFGQVLDALKKRGDPALRLDNLPYASDLAQLTWRVNITGSIERPRYLDLPLLRDEQGVWRFTPRAVEAVTDLHAQLFPDAYFLRGLFERFGLDSLVNNGALGIAWYQWISLAALIVLAWLLDLAVRLFTLAIIRRYLRKDDDQRTPGDTAKLIKKAAKPFGLAAAGLLMYFGVLALNLSAQAEGILRVAAQIFALFGLFLALSRVIDLVGEYFHRRALKTSTKFDDLLVPLLRKSAKTLLFALALLTVAESLSLPITSLVAGFGIAGAAIAFASKDTVENLFGSVAVILDRPFNAGDWVVIGDTEGIVEQLGFRSTRIRTFYNSLVTVPNALLVRAQVDNYGVRRYRRYKTTLSLLYSTPPDRIEAFVEGLRELVRAHPDTRKDYFEIHFRDFGAHSLDIMVYLFFRVPDWSAELTARHRLNIDVLRLAKRVGVEFAFPTQTIELNQNDGDDTPPAPIDAESAREAGRDAATALVESKLLD